MLWVRIPLIRWVLDTTLCDKVCQWLVICGVFRILRFPQLSRHDIAEILSKVTIALTLTNYQRFSVLFCCDFFWAFDEYGQVGSVIMVVTSPILFLSVFIGTFRFSRITSRVHVDISHPFWRITSRVHVDVLHSFSRITSRVHFDVLHPFSRITSRVHVDVLHPFSRIMSRVHVGWKALWSSFSVTLSFHLQPSNVKSPRDIA